MKNILNLGFAMLLLVGVLQAQDPQITNANVNPTPLATGTSPAIFTLQFFNTDNDPITYNAFAPTIINWSTNKWKPNLPAEVTGTAAMYFTWTVTCETNCDDNDLTDDVWNIRGLQNQIIPGDPFGPGVTGGTFIIAGEATDDATQDDSNSFNGVGFAADIVPAVGQDIDPSPGSNNQRTYTYTLTSFPVKLLSFTAESKGLDGELNWVTASEVDNDRFEVERSLDGKRFAKIGVVKGNGTTTSKQSYSFTDKGIGTQVNGRVYYRLNQVDYDGTSEASEVRYISFGKGGMSVYPNPTTGILRIEVPVSTSVVKVYNSVGELVKQSNHNSDDAFELSELVDGVYNIRVEDEQGEVIGTERIVKIK